MYHQSQYKPKPQRIHTPGKARFITFGCYHHIHLFKHDDLCELFLQQLVYRTRAMDVEVWAYVIMPNHIHLVLFSAEDNVRKMLQLLKRGLGKQGLSWCRENDPGLWKRLHDAQGIPVFWQRGGGYDFELETPEKIREKIVYMHNNPVRAGIVEDAVDFRWSSCKEWESEAFETVNAASYPV